MKVPFLIGRLLFGGFFLYNGIHHFIERKTLSQYADAKGVPEPDAAVAVTGGLLIVGGTSILLGIRPKLRQNDMINFAKNLALLGGATALMAVEEPWPASVPLAPPGTRERIRRFAKRAIAA
jgi:putative oxidoreductase